MRIYAADDEKIMRAALQDAICRAAPGVEVEIFRNGSELLAAAAEKPCDVAFLDVEMPGLSGMEAARRLQSLCPAVNVIFVTGYAEYAVDALEIFASGYVMKPVNTQKIRQQLDHLRNPVQEKKRKPVYAQTFGIFTLFYMEKPVIFSRKNPR